MSRLDFETMQRLQRKLQEKYKDKWARLCPEHGRSSLLWMIGEASETADVIKKRGDRAIMENPEVRKHFIEEMCDTLMYFNDLMLCYGVTPEELENVYLEKHEIDMKRW